MNRLRWLLCCLLLLPLGVAAEWLETPALEEQVAAGELPPVDARLPAVPRLIALDEPPLGAGRHGGDLHMLMARGKDVRLMVVYGYARLVVYDRAFDIVPDLLESFEVEEGRIFTLRLREGHRWSDGQPFTVEDFRYWWEDVAHNSKLTPFGLESALLIDGEEPTFEIVDPLTVRYTWSKPNPYFLPALAAPQPPEIYAPAHYLKQFHADYRDAAELKQLVKQHGQRNWAALHNRLDEPYKNTNVDLPSLQPWYNTTSEPAQRFVFKRNPFYHRVDANGRQLPYIDRVIMDIADSKLVPAKTGAGESDLQARYLHFGDYAFLKQSAPRTGKQITLWRTTKGAHIALYPNLNTYDDEWRLLFQDVRFRRALSLAINRHELNQVLYYGLAREGNNVVSPESPLYREEYRSRWAGFDIRQANALLDEMGLTARDDQGIRLLPDGRSMTVVVETAGEDTEQTDALELIHDSWLEIGIKLFSKPMQREVFRNRVFSGSTLIGVWGGLENALVTNETSPQELAPTSQQHLQWPMWGSYFESDGQSGEPPTLPEVVELAELLQRWREAPDAAARRAVWHRMLDIWSDQVFTIGLIAGVPQPVVASRRLHNVPAEGIYNWEPGSHFGIYRPDTFWFAEE